MNGSLNVFSFDSISSSGGGGGGVVRLVAFIVNHVQSCMSTEQPRADKYKDSLQDKRKRAMQRKAIWVT